MEEVFFRSLLFGRIAAEGYGRFALFASALVFAALHLNVPAFPVLFLAGLALAWAYRKTGSLLTPNAMHAVWNAVYYTASRPPV